MAVIVDVTHEATGSIAALLHFLPVRIEDAVIEVGACLARRFDLENLVAADPEAAVGQKSQLLRCEDYRPGNGVEHHKVISQAMHFGEFYMHLAIFIWN
jgi:hypothetical protein